MLIPLSINLGLDDPSFFEIAPARVRSLIENNLTTESSSMTVAERAALAKRFGRSSAPVMARLVSYGIAVLKAIESIACVDITAISFHSDCDPITLIFTELGEPGIAKNFCWKTRFLGGLPLAPAHLEVFARIAHGVRKIVPCEPRSFRGRASLRSPHLWQCCLKSGETFQCS
jgi:hypothetical protein